MTAQGDRTLISLTITGVPPWVVRPIWLFTFVYAGSCAKRDATPAYALNDTVQVNAQDSVSGPFTIAKTVPVSLATLRTDQYAIVLRTSPADGNLEIFCGDMAKRLSWGTGLSFPLFFVRQGSGVTLPLLARADC